MDMKAEATRSGIATPRRQVATGGLKTAFMFGAFTRQRSARNPFTLNPGIEAAKAVWNGLAEYQVAWPFTPLIVDDIDDFIGRWAGWFATASQGQLQHPSTIPERPTQGSWRS